MINVNIDLSELQGLFDIGAGLKSVTSGIAGDVAQMIKSKAIELANERLHSRRKMYIDGLSIRQESDDTFVVSLDGKVRFIDDGLSSFNLLESLLKSPKAKRAKDGCVLNPRNKILTSVGWKKIKDIQSGDLVLTHSGKFREVKELLINKAGVGTEFVNLWIASNDRSKVGGPNKENSELTSPKLSVTPEHLVLTPTGWIEAKDLKKGDLVATPADLTRLCKQCSAPLPINTPKNDFCLNNRCSRIYAITVEGKQLGKLTKEERIFWGKVGNQKAKEIGCFDREDWGARNPTHLKKMRLASSKTMRKRISDGAWMPELFTASLLRKKKLKFRREFPIKTNRIVNAGGGRTRKSILYCDFYLPEINTVIELDGTHWHSRPEVQERDKAKDEALMKKGIKIIRIPSHKVYGPEVLEILNGLVLLKQNHSGNLGIAWVRIEKIITGIVNRPDHIYAKKYDIVLDAEEHSFCCETIFIHNSTYITVPFEHGPGKGAGSFAENSPRLDIISTIKSEMKKRAIPWSKIEKDANGAAKIGRLHAFDITKAPLKTVDGPGMGHGAIGDVRQGTTGVPFLQGVSVYQGVDGKGKAKRGILTFRVASSKHKDQGKWEHPGTSQTRILDDAAEWALQEFQDKIAPEVMKNILNPDED